VLEVKQDINKKHADKKQFMFKKYVRARDENELVIKERDYRKYEKQLHNYAYPLNEFRFANDGELK
jgi:hypothetical protein